MKLLITSIDAIIDKATGNYFDGIKEVLHHFESLDEQNKVVILSIHKQKLEAIPDDFYKLQVNGGGRKGAGLIQAINNKLGIAYNDMLVLGAKEDDFILAANSKLILLTADYAKQNNPEDRIYANKYGICILNADRLRFFIDHFLNINKPWYYTLQVDEDTKLYGLTNAMTLRENNQTVRQIGDKLRDYLKEGLTEFRNPFLIYALISVYQIFKEASEINYWGYYPSSTAAENVELKTFKEVLRMSFKSTPKKEDILIRHKPSVARKTMSETRRVENGCDSEFDSIIVNPAISHLIYGKNVCIIDDFTNHGTSCEAVRHLLKKAGVNKIIFIALGKFRVDYKIYNYELDGDVCEVGYTYKRIGNFTTVRGTINPHYSDELIESLKHLVS
ncbi:phosphoribosyltransferase [Flavobacterium sp. SM15]|uniref:phosphoribosyltransferase n=1 Tax=Flavobacterium sp. SM15 TaxID=2908005 RepID=UPI001EDA4482|nr:phosphoribosyltransferase [Flavobacterium sp. SM15]MCG2611489.1 phosphoribosyltransferase [Flavobacterium sp. SM15]